MRVRYSAELHQFRHVINQKLKPAKYLIVLTLDSKVTCLHQVLVLIREEFLNLLWLVIQSFLKSEHQKLGRIRSLLNWLDKLNGVCNFTNTLLLDAVCPLMGA